MLEFNATGLLTPPSIIKSSIDEFERYFAIDSPENIRKILFANYLNYCKNLKELCEIEQLRQWIDGSFVTKKPKPGDIDFVTFVNFEIFEAHEDELKGFIYPESSANYRLDSYIIKIYPENHKLNYAYKADCAYWINQFDKTEPDKSYKRVPKGSLEIII